MDVFSKVKALSRLVLALVLINVCALVMLWLQTQHDPHAQKPTGQLLKTVQKKLDLTEDQKKKWLSIRAEFFSKEEVLSALIRSERDSMNEYMFNRETDTLQVQAIARRVADNEYKMEMYRIDQAIQLKKVCTSDQLDKFHDMVIDIRDFFQPRKK